ncbi:MAG: hypothetical protein WCD49_00765 [Candidatus Acidiferrales bacterium]
MTSTIEILSVIAISNKGWDYRTTLVQPLRGLEREMSYHFGFDSANRILLARFEGKVTDADLKEYYRMAERYVMATNPSAGVLDMSAVSSLEVSPQTIRELASLPPAFSDPHQPRCIIAPSPKIFGMARMFELQGQHTRPNLHVVRTAKEAWAILGVSKPKFELLEMKG